MTEVKTELDSRYDNIDVDSILARCQNRKPLTFAATTRCLYQAPEFIQRLPATEEVEEGSTVTFSCKVAGFPAPSVTWYKDDDVIEADSRAKVDYIEAGLHSITIADVSKCDAGIYKAHASNLEGSSKSMLYISVKAKSKIRNRKNGKRGRRSRPVACAPMFPAIIEHVAEEQKETLAVELQPSSPLTPLYCTISRKGPVTWPTFLGDWAFNKDDILHKDELDDIRYIDEDEDVFEDEDIEVKSPYGLTFVSKAYAELKSDTAHYTQDSVALDAARHLTSEIPKQASEIKRMAQIEEVCDNVDKSKSVRHTDEDNVIYLDDKMLPVNAVSPEISKSVLDSSLAEISTRNSNVFGSTPTVCDKLNNNDKSDKDRNDIVQDKSTRQKYLSSEPQESETILRISDSESVAAICVHRSYAKGDTTSSVARRSPSPLSRSRNTVTLAQTSLKYYGGNNCDTSALQNFNNERILQRMSQQRKFHNRIYDKISNYFRSAALGVTWEDQILEMILFVCASTFLALCLNLPPTTFIIDILVALFVRVVLAEVFADL